MPRGKKRVVPQQHEPELASPYEAFEYPASTTTYSAATAATSFEGGGAGYYVPSVAVSDISTSGDEGDDPDAEWAASMHKDGQDETQQFNAEDGEGRDDGDDGAASPGLGSGESEGEEDDEDEDDEEDDEGASSSVAPAGRGARGKKKGTAAAGTAATASTASKKRKRKKEAVCKWQSCGEVFLDLDRFIDHLHNAHVGHTRTRYACEWTGCSRRGKPQTSRFALLSHLRSHTGEKPFTCPRPECDKSFTRSDALSKHMRVQHDIQPAPARGGRQSAAAIAAAAAASAGGPGGVKASPAAPPQRTSGRRSAAAAAAAAAAATEEADGELLALAGDRGVNAAQRLTRENVEALPGQPLHWTYEAMFPGQLAGEAGYTDDDLGIERLNAVRERLGMGSSDAEWVPTAAIASTDAATSAGQPTVSVSDAKTRATEAATLEAARRQWVEDMAAKQNAEQKASGGSNGTFKLVDPQQASSSRMLSRKASSSRSRSRSTSNVSSDSAESGDSALSSGSRAKNAEGRHKALKRRAAADDDPVDTEMATLKRACLIESSKLKFLRQENQRLVSLYEGAIALEAVAKSEKRSALEMVLEYELGADVRAIFSPPPNGGMGQEGGTAADGQAQAGAPGDQDYNHGGVEHSNGGNQDEVTLALSSEMPPPLLMGKQEA